VPWCLRGEIIFLLPEEKSHTSLSADRDAQIKECGRGGATSKTYLDNKIYLCIRDKELSSSICLC
jgi:hypothetical protein